LKSTYGISNAGLNSVRLKKFAFTLRGPVPVGEDTNQGRMGICSGWWDTGQGIPVGEDTNQGRDLKSTYGISNAGLNWVRLKKIRFYFTGSCSGW